MSYKRTSGNIQVSGFTDDDVYGDVVTKGTKGLDIKAEPEDLFLIVSNGLVVDTPLRRNKPWTLGNYVEEIGGVSVRGKKTFGIYIPIDVEEEEVCSIQYIKDCALCIFMYNSVPYRIHHQSIQASAKWKTAKPLWLQVSELLH